VPHFSHGNQLQSEIQTVTMSETMVNTWHVNFYFRNYKEWQLLAAVECTAFISSPNLAMNCAIKMDDVHFNDVTISVIKIT